MLNTLFVQLGIEAWKPVLTALALPPAAPLVLLLCGAGLLWWQRASGWAVVGLSAALLWLSGCTGAARLLANELLHPPAALTTSRIHQLRAHGGPAAAIVVLGGGVEGYAPEYGAANLQHASLERLRYGVWLGGQTGLPVAFSGGVGWSQIAAESEAYVASRIAADEFKRPLKWAEDRSRDTRENAVNSVSLLKLSGVKHIVLVTHAWHMPRALRAFEDAAAAAVTSGASIRIEPAPLGLARRNDTPVLDWIPSPSGLVEVRQILRELAGRLAGA